MDEGKEKLRLQNKAAYDYDFQTLKEVIDKHESVRENFIRYTYQIITAIGVVAGFGFTAISFVKIIYLFILGEALLLTAMAIGMRFVKRAFLDDAAIYAGIIDKLGKAMDERLKLNSNDTIKNIEASLQRMSKNEVDIFEVKPRNVQSNFILGSIFYTFIFGAGCLLLSFLNFYLPWVR